MESNIPKEEEEDYDANYNGIFTGGLYKQPELDFGKYNSESDISENYFMSEKFKSSFLSNIQAIWAIGKESINESLRDRF